MIGFAILMITAGLRAGSAFVERPTNEILQRQDRKDIVLSCDFEDAQWWRAWGMKNEPAKNEFIEGRTAFTGRGKSLKVTVPRGGDTGANFHFRFKQQLGFEPEEIYFRYYLKLDPDWKNASDGGKLPGISATYGKAGWGGRKVNGTDGWSARGHFKKPGADATEIGYYCYHADMKGKFGDILKFKPALQYDRWYCIEQYCKLNSVSKDGAPGKKDGILRAWIDGRPAYERTDLRFRDVDTLKIESIWVNVYHGGTKPAPDDLHLYLDDMVIAHVPIGPRDDEKPANKLAVAQRVPEKVAPPSELAEFFRPPEKYRSEFGPFRSPLQFADGTLAKSPQDWSRRRTEILETWHKAMGRWPALIDNPRVETVQNTRRENITQHHLRLGIALGGDMVDAFLLVPDGKGPFPAVVVTYYDAQSGVGLGTPLRDYGWHLAKRGFIVLSMGRPSATVNLDDVNKAKGDSYLGPSGAPVRVQPLSALAYVAANAHAFLARRADVIASRIGIVGHSFGGKWALFASCLYEPFACAVWSDPGIVFDERNRRKENPGGSVNYWDVWYLGFELGTIADPKNPGPFRKLPSEGQARTGAYKKLVEGGHDLVELHALMAPRPFLVSGGTADMLERWPALNHTIAVNRLLGNEDRVAMTNRKEHGPSAADNEQVYQFFEWWLKRPGP